MKSAFPLTNRLVNQEQNLRKHFCKCLPNGLRYLRVGGTRQRHFAGANFKPRKLPENAQTPTRRVHAVLGSLL
ncbi:MAG TPA: hypothetical protein VK206_20870 [Anaerolineales bacterium]|nr:hypothetical protein [Anaerolineales bacterium]